MMRFWTRSLAAQFIGFTLLALIVSQGIAVVIFWEERSKAVHAAMKGEFFSRLVSITSLMESLPPNLRNQALQASETNSSRFWLTDREVTDPAGWRSRAAEELTRPLENFVNLKAKWGLSGPSGMVTFDKKRIMAPGETDSWTRPHQLLWNMPQPAKFIYVDGTKGYGLSVELNDGTWLHSVSYNGEVDSWLSVRFITSIVITALTLSLIGVFIASRIAHPLRRLAVSAEALGRGENVPPLPEEGPDDIRRTAEAFNRMQERLHRFVKDRTRMLAAIGHDLRTPLTSLRLRTEFVKDPEIQEKMLATIDELQNMTEAAIAFARGEATVEETRAMDLQALVGAVCDDLADLGHPVSHAEGPKINYRCRPDGLRRAVRNLVENAVRYGGEAQVEIRRTATALEISIGDHGPGIPETLQESVFAPFFRLEASRNRDTGGVGLGLSIARAIARQHGGDVSLACNNPGLKAVISLPLDGMVDQPPRPDGPAKRRKRILASFGQRSA